MRSRGGFTLIELLVVIVLVGVVAGTAIPQVGRSLAQSKLQRASSVVAAEFQLAHSIAMRQQRPVRLQMDTVTSVLSVRDFTTPTTIYSQRHLGHGSEYGVQRIGADRVEIVIYPNGLASNPIRVSLRTAGKTRVIRMSKAGQVRVSAQ